MLQQYFPQYRRRNLSEPLDRILAKNKLHYLDLFSDFATDGESPYYFSGTDNHWNDNGQAKAAEIVAAALVREQLLAPPTVSQAR